MQDKGIKGIKTSRPPIHTAAVELTEWSLGRTADFPKGQRFTLGQKIDNLCLAGLEEVTRARFSGQPAKRKGHLDELNLILELLRILWRLAESKSWISGRQCLHVNRLIDEVGRMAGAWRKSVG